MALDPVKNFINVDVSTGYNDSATSIDLSSGDGADLPDPSTDGAFNMVWYDADGYNNPGNDPNVEIVRVTARSGDTLTITRGQEDTTASTKNTSGGVYKMLLTPTAKTIEDIQSEIDLNTAKVTNATHTGEVTGATTLTIANNAVVADKIANDAVTNAKIAGTGTRDATTFYRGDGTFATPEGGGITWSEVTGTTQAASVNAGYIANNAGLVTITLPTTAAVGDVVRVTGKGAGGWLIAQNASQIIHFLGTDTTTGTGGSLASTGTYDGVEIVCVVANTEWVVISSMGNITIL